MSGQTAISLDDRVNGCCGTGSQAVGHAPLPGHERSPVESLFAHNPGGGCCRSSHLGIRHVETGPDLECWDWVRVGIDADR